MDDREWTLLQQAKQGNREASQALAELYTGFIRSRAKHYAKAFRAETADLVQEGYIGLLNAIRRFNRGPEWPLLPWVKICVDSAIIDAYRRRGGGLIRVHHMARPDIPRPKVMSREFDGKHDPVAPPSPEARLLEQRDAICYHLPGAPERAKEAVIYRYVFGLTSKRIGQLMAISESRANELCTQATRDARRQRGIVLDKDPRHSNPRRR